VLRKAPPLPFLPETWHGRDVVILAACYVGDPEEGKRVLEPLRRYGRPVADNIQPHPFVAWEKAFDPVSTPGARNYWKSHNLVELSDGLFDVLIDFASRFPTPQCETFIGQIGGATCRVPKDAMAYTHRDTRFVLNVHTRWEDPAQDRECVAWAREFFKALTPHATGGVYVNFMPDDEVERIHSAYGENYARVAAIKQKYDPCNLFRLNQNVRPL
jgi:hypothetical protein